LSEFGGFEARREYTDGFSAIETLKTIVPDIILTNVLMTEKPYFAIKGYETGYLRSADPGIYI